MSEFTSEETKAMPGVETSSADSAKVEHQKIGDVVLIPQPTNDPEDPLVSIY